MIVQISLRVFKYFMIFIALGKGESITVRGQRSASFIMRGSANKSFTNNLSSHDGYSKMQCAQSCLARNGECMSVSYHSLRKECRLHSTDPLESNATMIEAQGYTLYQLECPSGWKRFRLSCYKVIEKNVTWTEAEANCRSLGAHLVKVNDAQENEYLKTLSNLRFWIGLYWNSTAKAFLWSDDSPDMFFRLETLDNSGVVYYQNGGLFVVNDGNNRILCETELDL